MLKIIIAGGRDFNDYAVLKAECNMLIVPGVFQAFGEGVEIVSGACPVGVHTFTRDDKTKVYGADGLGEKYAKEYGFPVKLFPAYNLNRNPSAGPIRNSEMVMYADALIAFYDGKSKGTGDVIKKAKAKEKLGKMFVKVVDPY